MIKCKTAVAILSWNGLDYLKTYLPGVLKYSESADCKVVVIDNASTDGTAEWLKENFPTAGLILNTENTGYAGGYQTGLQQIRAEYVVLLNQDVEVTPGWLSRPIEMLDQDRTLAAVQPKILDLRKRSHFEYAGAAGGKIDFLGYPFCRGRILSVIEEDLGQYDQEEEIAWASGACMIIRTEAFQKAGGLDPWFFAHMEEIDLCWRMIACGYHLRYTPNSVVYHLGGGSLPYGNPRKMLLNFRNNLSMLIKNLPLLHLLFVLPLRVLLDALAAVRSIIASRSFQDAGAIFSAWIQVMKHLPLLLQKRAELPLKTSRPVWRGSILLAYYLRGVRSYQDL